MEYIKERKWEFSNLDFNLCKDVFYQLPVEDLINQTIILGEGKQCDQGALVVNTGKFTGRSPRDRFIVYDKITENTVDWNSINQPVIPKYFDNIYGKMKAYLKGRKVWIRDCYSCVEPSYRLGLRIITETPWASLFCYNMFIRPSLEELDQFVPEWEIINLPGFNADPVTDGFPNSNFTVLNFCEKKILIGGSSYTGEIKKAIFSVLNYLLPQLKGVLSMHCSANVGRNGDTALFFGLSGTGKTTLSSDPERYLIGDDEHGWSSDKIFNLEGGCYAKCVNLSKDKEPQIYHAIKRGSLLENVCFYEGTKRVNYADISITENTRVSYPIDYIEKAIDSSLASNPQNIFFLTCDVYGVLPPISCLTLSQTMAHFLLGYTSKVAGTETGIKEPVVVFSPCYAAPFIPLHPKKYAEILREKIKKNKTVCWLVNTGWIGGPYGVGKRIELTYTRALIKAVFSNELHHEELYKDSVFDLKIPIHCKDIPDRLLNPSNLWNNKKEYHKYALMLLEKFNNQLKKLQDEDIKE